jgi:hypothetical protein
MLEKCLKKEGTPVPGLPKQGWKTSSPYAGNPTVIALRP